MRPLAILPALALAACLIAPAPPAAAGTYEHVSLPPGADGWSPAVRSRGGWMDTADATAAGRGLRIGLAPRGELAAGEGGEWAYAAPPGTEIAAWRAQRELTGLGAGNWEALVRADEAGRPRVVSASAPAADGPWADVAVAGLHAQRVAVTLGCGGPGACSAAAHSADAVFATLLRQGGGTGCGEPGACLSGASAQLGLRAAVAELRDDRAPKAGPAQGDLVERGRLRGVVRLAAAATDRGGGLLRTLVEADGAQVGESPVAGGAACVDLDPGPARRFSARVPCPLGAAVDASLDTRVLADGPHELRVVVEDAAGNRTTVYGPVTRVVANAPSPAGAGGGGVPSAAPPTAGEPAAAPAPRVRAWLVLGGRRAAAATVDYGTPVAIRGAVTGAGGEAAAGEAVTLLARVEGGAWRVAAATLTTAEGRFTAYAPPGPSRRLAAVVVGARSPELRLAVRAAAGEMRAVRRGDRVTVAGRLRGGRVPPGGVLVALQARRGGRWVALAAARSDRAGRFRARVRAPAGRAASEWVRAAVPRQPGYPFAPGSGPAVEVLE